MDDLIKAKNMYFDSSNLKHQHHLTSLLKILKVNDLDHPLQTMIFYDDAAHIFNSNNKQMIKHLASLRHNRITFFICMQTWKMIAPDVKSMLTLIYLGGGFNKRDLRYIYSQLPLQITFDDFEQMYDELKSKFEKIKIDCIDNSLEIVNKDD